MVRRRQEAVREHRFYGVSYLNPDVEIFYFNALRLTVFVSFLP